MSTAYPDPGDGLADRAADEVRSRTGVRPEVALVTGSGLVSVVERFEIEHEVPYGSVPGFPEPTVPGHEGRLLGGSFAGRPAIAFIGRFHRYEGHPEHAPALLPRLARALGAETFVATAAVGALDPSLEAGSVVVVRDHLNLQGIDPLRGWRMPGGTPAFVELAEVYDRALSDAALEAAREDGTPARPGVYAAVAGPSYETPAEAAFLRGAGATVVGMSVVPETVPAHALGMRVLAAVCVTNVVGVAITHDEVVRVSGRTGAAIGGIVVGALGTTGGD